MTRAEILKVAKPILFNTEMVRAILEGRKTVTRRYVKYKYDNTEMKMRTDKYGTRLVEIQKDVEGETHGKNPDGSTWHKLLGYIEPNPPYKKGDYLYVRETWLKTDCFGLQDGYFYKANETPSSKEVREEYGFKWRPSIHMPKEAARIFLRTADVRVERLQEITGTGILVEGIVNGKSNPTMGKRWENMQRIAFENLWNSTIKKSDIDRYGWEANPWVWVIEFERIKPDV